MAKIANKNASESVSRREVFTGNNLYAENVGRAYVVYSYGEHFPMFIFLNGEWYENKDKYSVSTSKQQNQARPLNETLLKKTTQEMRELVDYERHFNN